MDYSFGKKDLKILFIRGMGCDVEKEHENITRTYLESIKARLEYCLKPYVIEIAQLDGSGNRDKWLRVLEKYDLESYDVIIGHSTGVHALLKCAEKRKLKNLLLTGATPFHNYVRSEILTGWFEEPWDYEKIRSNTNKIIICNGKEDPFIKPEEAKILAENLNCKLYLFKRQRHLSEWWHSHIIDESGLSRVNRIVMKLVEELCEDIKNKK